MYTLQDTSKYTVFDIQDKLCSKAWIVPAYTCATGAEHVAIMRCVVSRTYVSRMLRTAILCTLKCARVTLCTLTRVHLRRIT